jgi:hypothetical protein
LWSSLSFVSNQAMGGFNAAWIGVGVLASGAIVLMIFSLKPRTGAAAAPETGAQSRQ